MDPRIQIIGMIDAQAARTLRLIILERSEMIDRLYPEVGSPERMKHREDLIHLCHELGIEAEGFLYQ